jgi:type IV pilus assembly protein PilW
MGRMQENARFAMEMLIRDIRMAGYTGCADDINKVVNHVNGGNTATNLYNMTNPVEGSESAANWQPSNTPVNTLVPPMSAGIDGITVRYLDGATVTIETPYMTTESAALHVSVNNGLNQGDIVAVSDCTSTDIFQITSADPDTSGQVTHNTGTGTPGNATGNFQKTYGGDASLVRFIARRYYIGAGDKGPALFRVHNLGAPEEMIEGVQNMQILYGEDTNNDAVADLYRSADAINAANWDNVINVRVGLLMRTLDANFSEDPDTTVYNMLGVNYGPFNDNFRRRVFTSNVLIRNRSQ